MGMIKRLLASLGVHVEQQQPPAPDIVKVESAVAIGRIFRADCERQRLQHELDMRGGPIIPTNDAGLGRPRGSRLGRAIADWLQ
jgi:hypothetical protein